MAPAQRTDAYRMDDRLLDLDMSQPYDPPPSEGKYRLTPWRWFVLFYFSVSNCNQCLAWFSFSSTDAPTMRGYFGNRLDKSTLDLLLNWGPIIGVAFFPIQSWVMQQAGGLRKGIWCGVLLGFAGNVVRCIPIVVSATGWDSVFVSSGTALALYHLGQILIAAAGPFQMGATTRLAVVWFGEHERTTATAVATTANGVGTTIGFLNNLWLAPSSAQVPNIFWFSVVMQAIPVLCALFYLPAGPPSPPSAAAAASDDDSANCLAHNDAPESRVVSGSARGGEGLEDGRAAVARRPGWAQSIARAGGNSSFVILVISASVLSGALDVAR